MSTTHEPRIEPCANCDEVASIVTGTTTATDSAQQTVTTSDLNEYRRAIRELYDRHTNYFFPNDSKDHAAVVYEVFFTVARERIRIFCAHLSNSVFGTERVVAALRDALGRGVCVDVLSEFAPDDGPFLTTLLSPPDPSRVKIRTADKDIRDYNFAVVDNCAFRFERDHERSSAKCNMHLPQLAKQLSTYFDTTLFKINDLRAVSLVGPSEVRT